MFLGCTISDKHKPIQYKPLELRESIWTR